MIKKNAVMACAVACMGIPSFAQSSFENTVVEPVVVTGSRLPQPISQSSVVVEVIDRQRIEASGASNITEFLDTVSGLSVNRLYGRMGVDATVDIGYMGDAGAQNVLVLIDGQRLNTIDQANIVFGQLPISSIERIEIRKANGGALYGDRAQGGVINIITRSDAAKSAGLSVGSYGQRQIDAYMGFKSEDVRGSVSGMSARSDGYRAHSKSRQDSMQIKLTRSLDVGLLDFSVRTYEEDAELPSILTPVQFKNDPRQIGAYPDKANRKGSAYGLRYAQDSENMSGWSVDLNAQDIKSQGYYEIQNQRATVMPEYRLQWLDTQLIAGAELFNAQANTNGSKQVKQQSQSLYVQALRAINEQTHVDASVRSQRLASTFKPQAGSDGVESSDTKTGFGLGLRYKPNTSTQLRLGGLSGFRFANAEELYYFHPSTFAPLAINFGVKPMTTQEYFLEMLTRHARGKTSVHLRHIDAKDEIGYASGCATVGVVLAGCNANLYSTRRDVLSISTDYAFRLGWTVRASADFIDSKIGSGTDAGRRIPLTPTHVVRLSGEKQYQNKSFMAAYQQRSSMPQSTDQAGFYPMIPSRGVIDLGLRTQQTPQLSYSVWVRNALNKSYYDFAKDNGIYPADGRSIQVNMKVNF